MVKKSAIAALAGLALFLFVSVGCGKKQDAATAAQATAASSATHNVGAAPVQGYTPATDTSADAQKYRALQQADPKAKPPYAR